MKVQDSLNLEEVLRCITVHRVYDVWDALSIVATVHAAALEAQVTSHCD